MTKSNWNRIAQLVAVLLCAVGLKAFYSTASVNQLRWILAPTTWLVELVTGSRFTFEAYTGYINTEHTFVIAAACAGVNFVIACFLMLAIREIWRERQRLSWAAIPIAAAVAYLTTIVANTVRISIALHMRAVSVNTRGLSPEQAHRLEGVMVYFGFLLLLFFFNERVQNRGSAPGSHWLRSIFFPLVIYYATTLGMPFLNGAYRSSEFWEHSKHVLLAPIVLMAPVAAARMVSPTIRRLCRQVRLRGGATI